MRQLDLSGFAPEPAPPSEPDPNAAIIDGTLAQALNNDFIARQQELLHDGPEAFYRKQGADALAATPAVLDQLDALRDQLLDTTTTLRQRQILAQSLDNHLAISRADVGRHVARQTLAWQDATAQTRLALLQKQAGFDYDNPDSIANYAEAARSAALHQAEIADPSSDSHEAQVRAPNAASAIWRAAIEAALAEDKLKPAIALHRRAVDDLSPADAAALDRSIEGARERETGRDYVAKFPIPEGDPSSSLDIAKNLSNLDAAHAAATAQNEADWPDDASQRATNQHFIDVRFGQKKRDAKQAQNDLDQFVSEWISEPGQLERPPLQVWARLAPEERLAIDQTLATNIDHLGKVSDSRPSIGAEAPRDMDSERLAQVDLSPHAVFRMQQRGVSAKQLEDAINSPNKIIQPNGNTKCTANGITVILNPQGKVVTCY